MPEHHKYCCLVFDEMAIAPHLDVSGNQIIGFVEDGDNRSKDFADHALVFMVRGVIKKFKQPVHYSFCAGTTKTLTLKKLIVNIVKEVQNTGLKVVATICDQGTTNLSAINMLLKDTMSDYLRNNREYSGGFIEIGGAKIFPFYDPPHLMKGIRNNLLTKDLAFLTKDLVFEQRRKKRVAKWEHLVSLYQRGLLVTRELD